MLSLLLSGLLEGLKSVVTEVGHGSVVDVLTKVQDWNDLLCGFLNQVKTFRDTGLLIFDGLAAELESAGQAHGNRHFWKDVACLRRSFKRSSLRLFFKLSQNSIEFNRIQLSCKTLREV